MNKNSCWYWRYTGNYTDDGVIHIHECYTASGIKGIQGAILLSVLNLNRNTNGCWSFCNAGSYTAAVIG